MTRLVHQDVLGTGLMLSDWLTALAVFAAGLGTGWAARRVLARWIGRQHDTSSYAAVVIGRFIGYLAALAGLVYALSILDVRLGPLLGAIGIGGIAIALAAQSILSNFIASILLQVRRPFRRGDQIATNDHEGQVEDLNLRAVVLRSFDGQQVVVPAAAVLASPIVNYTRLGRRRTTLAIGVSYGADLREAQRVVAAAAAAVPGVSGAPPPEVLVESFGDSAVDLVVRFWHAPDAATMWRVRSEVAIAAKEALDRAGIEIPFPQTVVRLAGHDDGAAVAARRSASG